MVLLTLAQLRRRHVRETRPQPSLVSPKETLMSSRTLTLSLAALAAMLFGGAAVAQDTIKIGVTQPLTGAVAAAGNYVVQGAKVAESQINAAGGVLGKKIELVVEDNKSNPTEAVATVEKLIVRDKVPVIIGAWSSTFTLAVMPK